MELRKVLSKFYGSEEELMEDALRTLLHFKPELEREVAVELYLREEVSLSRAADMAGLDIEGFKSLLRAKGLKLRSYVGTEEAIRESLELLKKKP